MLSLLISSISYSETLICSSINTTFKNIDPILVTDRFTRNGGEFVREKTNSIYKIYYENDEYLILDNNLGFIGNAGMFYLDKQSNDFLMTHMGVGGSLIHYIAEGKCEVVN
mgnify:CR=1 FL=1